MAVPISIPMANGQPEKFELIDGPHHDYMPLQMFGLGVKADPERIRKSADKIRAMAALAEVEVPEGFDEAMQEAMEGMEGGHMIADALDICWN